MGELFKTLFELLVSHVWCDFTLQTDSMAKGKNHRNRVELGGVPWQYWMTAHCTVHATGVWYVTGSFGLAFAEFVLHYVIDFLKCEEVTNIHQDQLLHIICKVGYVYAICLLQ